MPDRFKGFVAGTLAAALSLGFAHTAGAASIGADVWADNWFTLYVNETLVAEDSEPITQERSFNAEVFGFEADRPFVLNFIAKDFKEDDSGLEYIGTRRQQLGDGGLIAQFVDADSGTIIAVTDSDWRCLVIHDGPADRACAQERNPQAGVGPCAFTEVAEPEGWRALDFDDSNWPHATEYPASAVRPKGGYDRIFWDQAARFIWGPDLETNNTVLCRLVVE